MNVLSDDRLLRVLLVLLPGSAVATSLYVQHVLMVDPCTLCILQRLAYVGCTALALGAATARDPARSSALTGAVLALAAAGGAVAIYNVWLQWFPAAHASCSAVGFGGWLDDTVLERPWRWMMDAPGDCSAITFRILGFSMPQASVLMFTAIGVVAGQRLRVARRGGLARAA